MKNIVTIGGGNGHSNLLAGIFDSDFYNKINLKSIVSMSDDGRTTGELMQKFEDELGLHLPPPGDLRRCLFTLSESSYRNNFQLFFEKVIDLDEKIEDLNLEEILLSLDANTDFLEQLKKNNSYFLSFKLPLKSSISGHKFGNILMATLYYNFLCDYNYMLKFMHNLLEVKAEVIPVTIDKAFIKAVLSTGEIVSKQDNISNFVNYSSKIVKLELMNSSKTAKHNFKIDTAILDADYIIISAGDLYTSTISNLIIGGIKGLIRRTKAKIIFVGNNTNKGGETENYNVLDFIITLEDYLGKQVDYFIANNKKLDLSKIDLEKFKNDISVKGGDYIYLTEIERSYLQERGTTVIEDNLLSETSLYKHNNVVLAEQLKKIIL